jgi:pyruvate dehydrogenase E1 component alpha subunit
VQVDGQDIGAVYRATLAARERAARGEGPSFIEALTYRYHGHLTAEVADYRTEGEVEQWRRTKDPIERLRRALERDGRLDSGRFDELAVRAREVVADAIAFAEESPLPNPATAADDVIALPFDPKGPFSR